MNNLQTYLNDHLAGSVGALELLDHLIKTSNDPAFRAFLTELREEISADQGVLQDLLRQVGGEESTMRKAGAWILEKMSRLKLQKEADDGGLGLFQSLEALALGITGKRALWRTLEKASETVMKLGTVDYVQLAKRATEQFEKVEAKCLEHAPTVLSSQ